MQLSKEQIKIVLRSLKATYNSTNSRNSNRGNMNSRNCGWLLIILIMRFSSACQKLILKIKIAAFVEVSKSSCLMLVISEC